MKNSAPALAVLGAAILAVVCCAGPAVFAAAVLGGFALTAHNAIGIAVGVSAAAAVAILAIGRARRCTTPRGRGSVPPPGT